TIEFYKLCLERLEKGGIMAQWLPLHTGSPDTYCNIAKAFQQVFPHASLWIMKDYTLIMGLPETLSISYPELAGKLAAEPVRSDLEPYCLAEPLELLDCFLMGENALGRMVRDARVSTDNLPLYQAESDKRPVGEILSMLAQHRERVFPFLRGMEGPQARAVRDSLELYFQAQAHLLRRDYAGAFRANPASCKYAEFYRDYQEEVPYIEALAACDPENNRTLLRLGTTLVRHREYSRAREVFAKLVSLNPGDRSLYSTLGNIDFKIGDYENSALNYGRARKLGGTLSQESTINLGMALLASGSQGQGIDVLASAVERDSTDVEALLYLGIGLNHAGEAGRAAACFEKVLELDPANLEAILDLATIYLGQGKLSRAEALFGRAVRIAPESPLAWEGLGKALYGLGRPLEARAAFERLLEISPGNRTALKFLEKKDSIP
ncbi:MAG: tetratricopeptide repeat protein, partial [Gemmatimonadota bacterium]|nr:tetratricopeptide repeat protein [Gemmatimonadota bacterium]